MNIETKTQEILTKHGLDFSILKLPMVGKLPITTIDEGGELVSSFKEIASPNFGLYNDKTGEIIHSCKKSYRVSQNDEVVRLVLEGMQNFGELSVHNAGALNGGKKVFIQLAVDGVSRVGEDSIKRYVTIIDSNDGSTGLCVGVGDFTMSCSNQFYRFHKNSQAKFRHSASLAQRIGEIPMLINNSLGESLRLIELYNAFQSNSVSRNLAHKMVNHLIGFDKQSSVNDLKDKSVRALNAMDALYEAITMEMNQKGNNLWGLHSGVTRWTTHSKSAPTRENGRFESVSVGTNYRTNQSSLAFTMEQAGLTF